MIKMIMFENKRNLSIIAFCVLCLFLAACVPSNVADNNDVIINNSDTPTSDVVTHIINEVPVIYTSIPELSSKSDTIIIGKIIATGEIINTARDFDDPAKPDPDYFSVGQIYEVDVEQYLKGDGDKIINILQNQGFLITRSKAPTTSEIERAMAEYDYVQLRPGQTYLFFINTAQNEYGEFTKEKLFAGVGHPWLFDMTDPECVQPLDTLEVIYAYFPPRPLTTFINQLIKPFDQSSQLESLPYPPPETLNTTCPIKSSAPYP